MWSTDYMLMQKRKDTRLVLQIPLTLDVNSAVAECNDQGRSQKFHRGGVNMGTDERVAKLRKILEFFLN